MVQFRAGQEYGVQKGIVVVVIRDLYGLKGSLSADESALKKLMRDLGFTPCIYERYVWMIMDVDTSEI